MSDFRIRGRAEMAVPYMTGAGYSHDVIFPSAVLRPSTSYTLLSQHLDSARRPLDTAGVGVTWSLSVTDASGASVSTGSLTALSTITDNNGQTTATLTTGSGTGLYYEVTVTTA